MNVQNIVQRCLLFNIYKTLNNNKTIFQNSKLLYSKYDKVFEEAPEPKKKKVFIPRITLISSDESISVTTLEEAKKISTRRDLKLVKITDMDTKTQRPIYRLVCNVYCELLWRSVIVFFVDWWQGLSILRKIWNGERKRRQQNRKWIFKSLSVTLNEQRCFN